MIQIEQIDTTSKQQVKRFIDLPYRLYADEPHWVPPLRADVALMLDRAKHPFYERSEADFFIASRDGRDVARIAALECPPYNTHHGTRRAQFYLFDCEEDLESVTGLFERVYDWARARGLTELVGPKGFSAFDGYGVQVEGFEHRQMMTMMNYNFPYYPVLLEALGFRKEVDFVSCYIQPETFQLPERVHRIAERVRQRGNLQIRTFRSKREVAVWADRIGQAYNQAFVNNWEYYPLSQREIDFLAEQLLTVADPRLVTLITNDERVVGFLVAFADVSRGLQRAKGRLFPFGILHLLLDMRRTQWMALNGAGILPEYHGLGGNALLYARIERAVRDSRFQHAELTQVAETAVQMRHDLENLGARPYKNHRVYLRDL
ncbi:MAG: hypothetical protein GX601_12160 [Anaerolineales bacterium]|nr:hypothetical protein [Anaerolineales bacterium]